MENAKILSLVYKPKSKEAYALFEKKAMTSKKIQQMIDAPSVEATSVPSSSLDTHILIRLFLAGLNNDTIPFLKFNNIDGRFFLYFPDKAKNGNVIKAKKKAFTACEVMLDENLNLSMHAVTFASIKRFNKNSILGKPKYIINSYTNTLKRVVIDEKNQIGEKKKQKDEVYIEHGLEPGKAKLDFLRFDENNDRYKKTKVFLMYQILNHMNKTYSDFLKLDFKKPEISKIIDTPEDTKIRERVLRLMKNELSPIALVNSCEDEEGRIHFNNLVKNMNKVVNCTLKKVPRPDMFNVIFMHDQDYYEKKKQPDPYRSLNREEAIIQVVTDEEIGRKIGEVGDGSKTTVISSLLKELIIKNDVRKQKITLADWPSYGFKENFYFGFLDKEIKPYMECFMKVAPNGKIEFELKPNGIDSKDGMFNELSTIFEKELDNEEATHNHINKDVNKEKIDENYIL